MYIVKNGLRSISRSKGRNLLIGIIIFVIALSSCIGLSIRQAAESAKKSTLKGLTVTAQISVNRQNMMEEFRGTMPENGSEPGDFDTDSFKDKMQGMDELTIEEMETYATAESVKGFYYTSSVSVNGNDDFSPVDTSVEEEEDTDSTQNDMGNFMGGMGMPDMDDGPKGFMKGNMGAQGDFSLVGYSEYAAMEDFISGVCSIEEGSLFEEGEADNQCIISDELALFNDISVGDIITITNPNNEEETYELEVSGTYSNEQSTVSNSGMMGGFSTSSDPANAIYTNVKTLQSVLTASEEQAETTTDEETGRTTTTAMPSQNSGTYVFADVGDYEAFQKEAVELGLSEDYTITSEDVSSYEESLVPLENLSEMATNFLYVILCIGAIVLIVLNIFNIRERKYEVGVMTAIGMKKGKVAVQFMTEIFVVTAIAVFLGGAIGAVSSVPVTNSLLASQIESQTNSAQQMEENFGKETQMSQDMMQGGPGGMGGGPMGGGGFNPFESRENAVEYITEISNAANLTVFLQLIAVGFGLTLVAGGASVVFIMRYEPLKILANRD